MCVRTRVRAPSPGATGDPEHKGIRARGDSKFDEQIQEATHNSFRIFARIFGADLPPRTTCVRISTCGETEERELVLKSSPERELIHRLLKRIACFVKYDN